MSFPLVPKSVTLNGVMAVTLRYITEFAKHASQHITASICGGIYARVYCILYCVYDVVVKKVHVCYLISWWVSCNHFATQSTPTSPDFLICPPREKILRAPISTWKLFFSFFTALHEMQTRSSYENSVCLSVCPSVRLSVTRVIPAWQNERKIGPDFYIIRKII